MANKTTNVFKRNLQCYNHGYKTIINQGSTSSSKTYSILQLLHEIAKVKKKIIHVIGVSVPHLKDGAIADFKNILTESGEYNDDAWNITDKEYSYYSGSKIKFISIDKLGKAHGPRRDILFLNEGNRIAYSIVKQLMLRTRDVTFIDFNPSEEFWLQTEVPNFEIEPFFIHSTYKDNPYLEKATIERIENLKETNEYDWKVYGLGLLAIAEGLIYPSWKICKKFPEDAEILGHWLDFGFSIDPSACGRLGKYNGEIYLDEFFYETGLTSTINPNHPEQASIEQRFIDNGISKDDLILADRAGGQIIRELILAGYNVIGVPKTEIKVGISIVKKWIVNITARSTNIIKEKNNYKWIKHAQTDMLTNKPIDAFNHHLDGIRYIAVWQNRVGEM